MPETPSRSLQYVLVVEDEMMLRLRAVDIVEDAGFRSVEAVNADEALSILEWRSQPIDATLYIGPVYRQTA